MEKQNIQNKDYDLEMAKYIWKILGSQPAILMSWGVDVESIRVIKSGIEFHVDGFKHMGKVRISLNEGTDLFDVILISDSGEKSEIIEVIGSKPCLSAHKVKNLIVHLSVKNLRGWIPWRFLLLSASPPGRSFAKPLTIVRSIIGRR